MDASLDSGAKASNNLDSNENRIVIDVVIKQKFDLLISSIPIISISFGNAHNGIFVFQLRRD